MDEDPLGYYAGIFQLRSERSPWNRYSTGWDNWTGSVEFMLKLADPPRLTEDQYLVIAKELVNRQTGYREQVLLALRPQSNEIYRVYFASYPGVAHFHSAYDLSDEERADLQNYVNYPEEGEPNQLEYLIGEEGTIPDLVNRAFSEAVRINTQRGGDHGDDVPGA